MEKRQTKKLVKKVDEKTNADTKEEEKADKHMQKYESHMTLYHWNMYGQEDSLKFYREMVYMRNDLEDKLMKQKVNLKLLEEETGDV